MAMGMIKHPDSDKDLELVISKGFRKLTHFMLVGFMLVILSIISAKLAHCQFAPTAPILFTPVAPTVGTACGNPVMIQDIVNVGDLYQCINNLWVKIVTAGGGGGGTPGGSNCEIQYNNAGAFGGAPNFCFDSGTGFVGIGTTAPTEELDIIGAIALNHDLALWADSPNANIGVGNSNFRNTDMPDLFGNGIQNTYIGNQALNNNITGFLNAAFGDNALQANISGWGNTAFGSGSLSQNTAGTGNLGFGAATLSSIISGNDNLVIGLFAGVNATTSNGNLFIGNNSGLSIIVGSNNILIGLGVDTPASTDVSDTLNIGNSIYGLDLGGTLKIGIGTNNPLATLEVNGNMMIDTGGAVNSVACFKADSKSIGHCTSIVGVGGGCTCV